MKLSIAAAAFISFTSFCLVHPATINVNPPDVPSGGGLNVQCTSQRDNVLKYAIDNASPGDTLILAPGLYYLACPTKIDKPLTILGACADWLASTDPNFNATSQVRPGCNATGETVIMASSRYGDSNGALQGIWINSNDVTVKGLSFYEDNEKFRGMFNILSDMPTGTYSNIEIINNYFNGEKATSTYHIGGNTPDKWPKTFVNLTFQGNFIKANSPSMWEPLSFRGAGFDTDPSKHATLVNFHLIGNTIAKSTLTDAVVNFHRTNNITGTTIISGNNLYDSTDGDGECPWGADFSAAAGNATFASTVPVSIDNTNPGFEDCDSHVVEEPEYVPCGSGLCQGTFPPTKAPTKAPSTQAPTMAKSQKAVKGAKSSKEAKAKRA